MFGKMTVFTFLAGLLCCNLALAANPEAGKAASAACAACHGAKGISASGTFPNLAGQKEEYLVAQLKALRAKTRVAPLMNPMAAGLKDDDIANLAAYYASLKGGE